MGISVPSPSRKVLVDPVTAQYVTFNLIRHHAVLFTVSLMLVVAASCGSQGCFAGDA